MDIEAFSKLDGALQDKLSACEEILRACGSVVVAFSGGVDSTFLLWLAARTLGPDKVLAAMGVSPSLAARERQEGKDLAAEMGVELVEIETCELSDPNFSANPPDRCFYCKQELLARLKELAADRGISAVVTGANADDTGDFRPGLQAGREAGSISPLLDAGLTKDDIRAASESIGLATWDKPAMACLASRVPYGQPITAEKLHRIEQAEYVLQDLDFRQCRVRDHDGLARIEVPADQVLRAVRHRGELVEAIKALGYNYVTIDLEGFRSGSMNEPLAPPDR